VTAVVGDCVVTGVCGMVGVLDLLTGLLMLGKETTSEDERGGAEEYSST
jgi:hypothetical protein